MSIQFPGGQQTRAYGVLLNSIAYVGQNGVKNGCLVTESSPQAMTVDVASGDVFFASSTVSVSADPGVSIDNNTSNNPRIDVVRVDNTGKVDVVKGTTGAVPLSPEYDPDNYVALAMVIIPSQATEIAKKDIIDARTLNNSGGASGTSFTGLSDTPNSLTGQSGRIARVNKDESGLELGDIQNLFLSSKLITHNVTDTTSSLDLSSYTKLNYIELKNIGSNTAHFRFASTATTSDFPIKAGEKIILSNVFFSKIDFICDTSKSTNINVKIKTGSVGNLNNYELLTISSSDTSSNSSFSNATSPKDIIISNTGSNDCYINIGNTATTSDMLLKSGEKEVISGTVLETISAICNSTENTTVKILGVY